MNHNYKIELYKQREYIIAKSNSIIQKSRYELSVTEQRTIAYICSMIKPLKDNNSSFLLDYEFNILDYAKVCGLSADNGRIYEETKATLKGLISKTMWLTLEDGTETTVNWVQKVWTNKRSGKAKVRIDEDMAPYLFNLQEKFTQYGLINILAMKSQYSIRLYEILKSYAFQKTKTFDITDLKKMLMVDNIKSYSNFKDFRKKVLQISQDEINNLSDLNIIYNPITKGKKVIKIEFIIHTKTPLERTITNHIVNNKLDEKS